MTSVLTIGARFPTPTCRNGQSFPTLTKFSHRRFDLREEHRGTTGDIREKYTVSFCAGFNHGWVGHFSRTDENLPQRQADTRNDLFLLDDIEAHIIECGVRTLNNTLTRIRQGTIKIQDKHIDISYVHTLHLWDTKIKKNPPIMNTILYFRKNFN